MTESPVACHGEVANDHIHIFLSSHRSTQSAK